MYESSRKILPEIPYEIQHVLAYEPVSPVVRDWLSDLGYRSDEIYPFGMPMNTDEERDAALYTLHEIMIRQDSTRAVDQIADYLD
jgi:hypothetical protein